MRPPVRPTSASVTKPHKAVRPARLAVPGARVYSADARSFADRRSTAQPDPPAGAVDRGRAARRRRLSLLRPGRHFARGAGPAPHGNRRFRERASGLGGARLYRALYCRCRAVGAGRRVSHRYRRLSVRPRGRRVGRRDRRHHRRDASSSWWRAPRSASPCCGGPGRAPRSWRRASATMPSAIFCFCGWCRRFRFFWSIWCRPSPACGWRRSSRRPRSASFRAPLSLPSPAPASTASSPRRRAPIRPASPPAAPIASLTFNAKDVLTPQLIGALVALGLLALVPVVVKRLRARSRAAM